MANTEKPKFDKNAYKTDFNKKNYYRVSVFLNKIKDADLIQELETKQSKSDFIKQLIRDYVTRIKQK